MNSPEANPTQEPIRNEDLQKLTDLFELVEKFNTDHYSWGKLIGKALTHVASDSDKDEEDTTLEEGLAEAAKDMGIDEQADLYSLMEDARANLEYFGFELSKTKAEGDNFVIRIADSEKFISSIDKVSSNADDNINIADLLDKNTTMQMYEIDFSDLSTQDKEMLDALPSLASLYERLNSADKAERIVSYSNFYSTGKLGHYIEIEKEGLWKLPGDGFGPADWVKDITPERLVEYWEKALQTLHTQEVLGDAGVSAELRDHLTNCIANSSETLNSLDYYSDEIKEEMQNTLATYTTKLLEGTASN